MWISKIELTNFKSYRHAEFSFPEPEGEQNIVLIGGINGYGKTSVLEALYLCLYGKDAIVHLARAGLKTDAFKGYPSFLERAFNGEARRDSEDVMSVRVVVQKTKTKGIDILRRWYFRTSTGVWLEDETVVREVTRGVPGLPKTDGKAGFLLSDMLDDHFVPAHVAPFFFFDGEEVKKLGAWAAEVCRSREVDRIAARCVGPGGCADRSRDVEALERPCATLRRCDGVELAHLAALMALAWHPCAANSAPGTRA